MMQHEFNKPATKEFLDELLYRARKWGWAGDYGEVVYFINDLRRQSGLPKLSREESEAFPVEEGDKMIDPPEDLTESDV